MARRLTAFLVVLILTPLVHLSSLSAQTTDDFSSYSARNELTGDHADVFRLYWAFFGREPEVAGARYWVDQHDQCASLLDVTWSFSNSSEFRTRYGDLNNDQYVELVYANVLNRAPDEEGRLYWKGLLDSGELIQADVMLYFSLGSEFRNRHPLPSDGRAKRACVEPGTAPPAINPGTYVVGTEVTAGAYRVNRYWATLDASQEILDNDLVSDDGLSLAVVPPGAAFVQFSGQAVAVDVRPTVDPIGTSYTDGTYLVGNDISPGVYRISADEFAYGARLDASLEIIDNDFNAGSVIITIQPTDYAFSFSGTLQRIG